MPVESVLGTASGNIQTHRRLRFNPASGDAAYCTDVILEP